ncbi:hypothetical protein KAFR_0G02470 [Kazachstania africana CBS 2517]|uniref:CBM21 domain-containing protein n=1 Tax=Kazachstania africana (strain ATCC 22294 / BCRC 22015 / CBS 2517 / CECT 1963 / NBRC 1671 / NRRL Y-8276) TaxID=1071382 RepID=H2AY30_KAZAF|nr:hypothetical protein KAFR_0G02470 [Kazachstania africana CBS 2517]CCF59280.1 hypothetical protein KAFR_0G02470 [Kazachstania africana CBS 2517]
MVIVSLSRSATSLHSILLDRTRKAHKKNVRFSTNLTSIKKFDKNAEPITISNENSPLNSPDLIALDYVTDDADDDDLYWFNNGEILPNLIDIESHYSKDNLLLFNSDYDDDDEEDNEQYSSSENFIVSDFNWDLVDSNFKMLNGNIINNNIYLQSIQLIENEIVGYIVVDNLNYEKNIEVKITFNNWENIHYVNSVYYSSINSKKDKFRFVISLDKFKFFLKLKNIIQNNTLHLQFCCRYDVNNETYYDNNFYNNYQLTLKRKDLSLEGKNKKKTTMSTNTSKTANVKRIFNNETDYFNTSPMRHLYHNNLLPNSNNEFLNKKALSTTAIPTLSSAASSSSSSTSSIYSFDSESSLSSLDDFSYETNTYYKFNPFIADFPASATYSQNESSIYTIEDDVQSDSTIKLNNNNDSNTNTNTTITTTDNNNSSDTISNTSHTTSTLNLSEMNYNTLIQSCCFYTSTNF